MEFESKTIDHLGIVASVCDEIRLMETIDTIIEPDPQQKVTTGESVKAMILNGLGFVSKPLYLFPDFMKTKSMELFFRDELHPEDFNDDTLGRALDRIFDHNPTSIVMETGLQVTNTLGLTRRYYRLDTTTMGVHGEYEFEDMDKIPITITYGRPKDGRKSLKQYLISLITTTQADLPIWVATLSGNTSDKTHFAETIKEYVTRLVENKEEAFFVMDSAMYTFDNVKDLSPICQWISRVPESISKAKELIIASETGEMDKSTLDGYHFKAYTESYAVVEQKWIVIFSEQAYKREMKTLNKNIRKERDKLLKEVWHFGNREFKCEEDGRKALDIMVKKWKYHCLTNCVVNTKNKTGKRGRPKKDAKAVKTVYHLKASFEKDKGKIDTEMKRKGKFIIATNCKELDCDEALKEYKGLQGVERGFRFIKDPLFFASSVFLKSPKRIVSLVMIMALSLLVYSLAQFKLRTALTELKESLPDQKGKPTVKPTMRWIFQQFEGIHLLLYEDRKERVKRVLNLKDVHRKVLKLLGPPYEKTYLLE